MIQAHHLSFGYPHKQLYRDISFTLEAGEHCALIGSNGVGKSTLAELIRRPEEFLFDGILLREGTGRIGHVPQLVGPVPDEGVTVLDALREELRGLEEDLAAVCARMEECREVEPLLERYQQLLDEYQAMDAEHFEPSLRRQLHLAGLESKAELPLGALSGGERKLVAILRQLSHRPDLLILDEPDVFLDMENLNGLKELINAYPGTLLVITHNRFLLEHCFGKLWHLENALLQEYEGSFPSYRCALLGRKLQLLEASAAGQAEIRRAEEMVETLRKQATEVIDPRRGRTLKQKVSYLERVKAWQVQAPFVHLSQPDIRLPQVPEAEGEDPLLTVEGLDLTFDAPLLQAVRFTLRPGEKAALVGPNGSGKTSLLRALWQNRDSAIRFSPQARPAYFSQLQEEGLDGGERLRQAFPDLTGDGQVQAHLARYGFSPDSLDRRVDGLSGGERNLLALARLEVSGANLLLLDEPSSHLDLYAQLALERALQAYRGAVLLVCHDFYTVTRCADTILSVEGGCLRSMSARAFRKRVYKRFFPPQQLEREARRQQLETAVERALDAGDTQTAKALWEQLAGAAEGG